MDDDRRQHDKDPERGHSTEDRIFMRNFFDGSSNIARLLICFVHDLAQTTSFLQSLLKGGKDYNLDAFDDTASLNYNVSLDMLRSKLRFSVFGEVDSMTAAAASGVASSIGLPF